MFKKICCIDCLHFKYLKYKPEDENKKKATCYQGQLVTAKGITKYYPEITSRFPYVPLSIRGRTLSTLNRECVFYNEM